MIICKRCNGYINTAYREFFDPSCLNCGCSYPQLGTSENNKRQKGLRETIRYTGSILSMKELLGYITYKRHPNKVSAGPKLIVECPMCNGKSEVLSAQADPSTSTQTIYTEWLNGYKTAKLPITCPIGHSFRLKINKEGTYSWSE